MAILIGAAARLAVGALAAVLVLVGTARPPGLPVAGPPAVLMPQEPAAAGVFLAAYGRGDEAAAERLASPLYRAEWTRRGVSTAARAGLRSSAGALAFRYIGGVRVAGGFAQLLYTARATAGDGRAALSVWRADTDPDGRVVWLDLVWLFSDEVTALVPVAATEGASDLPLPPELAARRPAVLVGVRSAAGPEGYYGLGLPTPTGRPGPAWFLAVDADGDPRPGAWSYGQAPGPVEYGAPPRVQIDPAPDLATLRSAYLGTLRCVC